MSQHFSTTSSMRLHSALALLVVAVHHAQAFILPFHAISTRQSSFSARSPIQRSFAARKGPGDVKEQQIGVPTIFRELLGNTSPADAEEDEETRARKAVQEQQKQLERLDQPPQAPIPLPSKPNMVMIGFGVAVAMVSYISSPQWDVDR
jgi:hypothetical protein